MTPLWWSLTLAAVGVFGIWLAGRKSWVGWAVGLGAQVLWLAYALVTHQYGFIVSALAYGWVYGTNLLKWRSDKPHLEAPHSHSNTGTAADEEIAACPICSPTR